ncbi:nickel pincer cofactor biosynthesis protein LarB [Acetobacterium sp.]|uniref:nickel pincer cofactor biosynthesis protein LarB n=1 Tax=Acetobacterium sp. TaxID=1872094 RepID=UPI00271B61D2|nr:nickel pincer cofactor biosynthesis protein LarB [Acetobacterium sp.]MDO9493882.1 nickel pincer cofactor biosynthesis protein LarB [Acetobacterium sp.]
MNVDQLTKLLEDVKNQECEIHTALELLKTLPYEDLSYAKVDHHRELRNGYPEVIYSPGKTLNQIKGIVENMMERSTGNILASRAERDVFDTIKSITPDAIYYEEARSVVVKREEYKTTDDYILVVTAGTSDIPVAEEAAITAMVMGNQVKRLYDVGVAGIHRLLGNVPIINHAKVIIVVAGMEGALASVVGGLTDKPIVAVPTSIGYGASFGGISALLGMLTSCASGIGVVNIDNGFGAACMASKINKL